MVEVSIAHELPRAIWALGHTRHGSGEPILNRSGYFFIFPLIAISHTYFDKQVINSSSHSFQFKSYSRLQPTWAGFKYPLNGRLGALI